jgi:anhydro-N-acetylmuramic acid kinase
MRSLLVIGLMSGTSRDGVDAALTKITGVGPELKARLMHHTHLKYPKSLGLRLADLNTLNAGDICTLNVEIGEAFAKAAIKCAESSGEGLNRVDAIASHGQTIWHIPPQATSKRNKHGATLQIGEPAVIARRTGKMVVSGFRAADMAEGGQGAPLVPYVDYVFFSSTCKTPIAVHNIGGISNVTLVTPRLENVRAFDTGPGNSLMDAAMKLYFNKPYDRSGKTARAGKVNANLLKKLMSHPYLFKKPPKSTGLESFGHEYLLKVLGPNRARLDGGNIIATLTHFTAQSIADSYRLFVLKDMDITEAVFSGGGVKNLYLMDLIKEALSPLKVSTSDDHGLPSMAKEAFSFAVLAAELINGRQASMPGVTGVARSVSLGSITLP